MPCAELTTLLKDPKMGPSSALFGACLKPKVTTNEDKEGSRVIEGHRIGIGDAETAASNHLRVHNAMC